VDQLGSLLLLSPGIYDTSRRVAWLRGSSGRIHNTTCTLSRCSVSTSHTIYNAHSHSSRIACTCCARTRTALYGIDSITLRLGNGRGYSPRLLVFGNGRGTGPRLKVLGNHRDLGPGMKPPRPRPQNDVGTGKPPRPRPRTEMNTTQHAHKHACIHTCAVFTMIPTKLNRAIQFRPEPRASFLGFLNMPNRFCSVRSTVGSHRKGPLEFLSELPYPELFPKQC
jgi:hypothetical protein